VEAIFSAALLKRWQFRLRVAQESFDSTTRTRYSLNKATPTYAVVLVLSVWLVGCRCTVASVQPLDYSSAAGDTAQAIRRLIAHN
jgi:hypothetical protein